MRMKGCGGLPTTAIFSAFTVLVFCVWTDIPVTPRPLALRKDAVGSKQLSVCTLATSRLPSTSYSWISINRARIRVIMKVHKKQPFQGPLSKQVSESWGKHVEARIQWGMPENVRNCIPMLQRVYNGGGNGCANETELCHGCRCLN